MAPKPIIEACIRTLVEHVEELTELDAAIGDGDHGLNMKRGALAIQSRLAELEAMSLNDALKAMGATCMSTVGGSSGPVFGTLLVTLGRELPPPPAPPQPADLARALAAAIAALGRLGKVEVGQKTLLDVLDPVQKVLAGHDPQHGDGGDDIVARVRRCADDSAQATAQMAAIKGRASFLGERALGHVDPGSRSTALLIGAVCDTLSHHSRQDAP